MNRKLRLALVMVVGSYLVYCGSSAVSTMPAPSGSGAGAAGALQFIPDAHAQTPTATCKKWRVQQFLPANFVFKSTPVTESDGSAKRVSIPAFDTLDLPDGWEPFAAANYGSVTARMCISQ